MPKAVVNKLIAVLVLVACIAFLYVTLTMGETMTWAGLAATLAGSLFLASKC